MKIVLASDHAGYFLKEAVKEHLDAEGVEWEDFGPYNDNSVDYPDYGSKVALDISRGLFERGILFCGSGIGMSMVANRYPNVRAALCINKEMAELSRQHNDANILTLGARFLEVNEACQIIDVWLNTNFDGGRHLNRIQKIDTLSKSF